MCILRWIIWLFFFFQAEDGIRDLVRSRGLGDVYKRQHIDRSGSKNDPDTIDLSECSNAKGRQSKYPWHRYCLLYTSDAADDLLCVDLGGRRIIKKKK